MGLQVDPPFGLGQTFFQLASGEVLKNDSFHGLTGISNATYGDNWLGVVKEFTDANPITGVLRTNRRKVCVAVKNTSGAALLPKRVVVFNLAAGKLLSEVNGYSSFTNEERVGVVDEFLPSTGVVANDIFWVTIDGPTEVAHALSGSEIAAGGRVAAITAVTSGATTAGRVTPSGYTGAGGGATEARGILGYALSAGATNGASPLCLIKSPF